MGETLEALRRLQEVEQQLADLRRGEEKRRRQIRLCKRSISKSDELTERGQLDIRQHQMEVDRIELDVKAREQVLARHRETLNRAKTNKEYATILTTINSEKVDSAKLEARELKLLSEIDNVRAEIQRSQADQEAQRERLVEAERRFREYSEKTADRRKSLQEEREKVASMIPSATLATFNRVAEHHDGQALAVIVRLHPKRDEFACGGCNMKVTLEIVNALRSRDEIQFCSVCGRLLCLET